LHQGVSVVSFASSLTPGSIARKRGRDCCMPTSNPLVRCDRCAFSGSLRLWPSEICFYRLADGSLAEVRRRLEWCHSCHRFAPAEELPSFEEADAALSRARRRYRRLVSLSPIGWCRRLHPCWKARRAVYERRWRQAEALRRMLAARATLAKCLRCGSTAHELLPMPAPQSGEVSVTAVRHPGCGGCFLIDDTRFIRFTLVGVVYYYDGQGNRLGKSLSDYDHHYHDRLEDSRFP